MKLKTIEEGWILYRDKVIPKDAPRVQQEESRKAFYAGAITLFSMIMETTDGPEEQGEAFLTKINEEIIAHIDEVTALD